MSMTARSREAERAEAIVVSEAKGYDRWADAEQATPTIVALRARIRAALDVELSRSVRGRLKHLSEDDRTALVKMVEASINRVLHGPTLRLRQAASLRTAEALSLEQLVAALGELFDLSQGSSLADDADMLEEEALPSERSSEDAADSVSPKRRAVSEAP
jgi:glutamyl-tRNA reductase